jgi:hypothetical protein
VFCTPSISFLDITIYIWGGQIVETGHSQISVIFNIWYQKLCHIYGTSVNIWECVFWLHPQHCTFWYFHSDQALPTVSPVSFCVFHYLCVPLTRVPDSAMGVTECHRFHCLLSVLHLSLLELPLISLLLTHKLTNDHCL